MAGKFLIDLTDKRFFTPENADVIAFIRLTNPFAHSDVGELLFLNAKGLPEAQAYCPAPGNLAYVVLHTEASSRIFAIAWDMQGLAFRLSASSRDEALARGGTAAEKIGADWVAIAPWGTLDKMNGAARAQYWCERAYRDALAATP